MRLARYIPILIVTTFLSSLLLLSCQKDDILISGGHLTFSEDTVYFDTVFSSIKSSTHIVKLYNNEKQRVKVSVFLRNGELSPYSLNVDGREGKMVNDVEIAAEDSIFIFITMHVDSTDDSSPFVVEDELVAIVNANEYAIPILGYAQNAYYIRDSVLSTSVLLTDKPYVIINSALVDSGATLTVPAGVKIYMHRDSRLFVAGTLKIMGTQDNKVEIQGDRIDRKIYVGIHADVPGEWGGIYFLKQSKDNEIHHAIIKNGGLSTSIAGQMTLGAMIQVDQDVFKTGTPKLYMTNTIVKNSSQYGIVAFDASITAENCLIADCQSEAVALLQGGIYNFYDCTIGTFGYIQFFTRKMNTISLVTQNYYYLDAKNYVGAPLSAVFKNCILYGSGENEVAFQKIDDFSCNVTLDHCLVRSVEPIPGYVSTSNVILNENPNFKKLDESDFHLNSGSPAIDAGTPAGVFNVDLDGIMRHSLPSIGAYEFIP